MKVMQKYYLQKVLQMNEEQAMIEQNSDITPGKQDSLDVIKKCKRKWFYKLLSVDESNEK